jgi:hypothetical protein
MVNTFSQVEVIAIFEYMYMLEMMVIVLTICQSSYAYTQRIQVLLDLKTNEHGWSRPRKMDKFREL